MARRLTRRGSAPRGPSWMAIGGGALIAATLGILGFGAHYYLTAERAPALDKATLCPTDGPRAVTVVLVDASDDLPEPSKRQVQSIVADAADALLPYELLDIRVIDATRSSSRTIFARCNPGDGSGLSEWTSNPEMARRRWRDGFRQPTNDAIAQSMTSAKSSTSPIMASIQDVVLHRFTGRQPNVASRRLIIVSDMIENNPDYSQYSGDLSFARYRKSAAYRKLRTDLNQAEVSINLVQRISRKPADDLALIQFWREWISDSNGRFREATRLQGAG